MVCGVKIFTLLRVHKFVIESNTNRTGLWNHIDFSTLKRWTFSLIKAVLIVTLSTSFVMGVNIGGPNVYNSVSFKSIIVSLVFFESKSTFSSLYHGQEDIHFPVRKTVKQHNGLHRFGGTVITSKRRCSTKPDTIIYRQHRSINKFGNDLPMLSIRFVSFLAEPLEVLLPNIGISI